MKLDDFVAQVEDFEQLTKAEQVKYFVYFLVHVDRNEQATSGEIRSCFTSLQTEPYSNIPRLLSLKSKRGKDKLYIKLNGGFVLERSVRSEIEGQLAPVAANRNVAQRLRDLEPHLQTNQERDFLSEAIDCFEVEARRASVTMVWILAVYHLYRFILENKLTEFNAVLAKNNDKRVKISSIKVLDDFSEIPEGKFIEFCRSSGVITNDVRKILEEKLGTRNSAAHPSGVSVSELKAMEFIVDLIDNVVLKYRI